MINLFLIGIFISLISYLPSISYAQVNQIVEFIAGYCYKGSNINYCIQGIYNLIVALAVVIAFIMFFIGAFKNLLSVVPDIKMEGKRQMRNSIIGLIVIFSSGVLLYWINPEIFNARLIMFRVEITMPIIEVENWTDDDIKNTAYSTSLSSNPAGNIVIVPGYTNIYPANNDNCAGKNNVECVDECMLDFLKNLNNNLSSKGVKVILTDGYSQGGHQSKSHTAYGTAVDLVPQGNTKDDWEKVCEAIIETPGLVRVLYEAGPWEELKCGNIVLKRLSFSKTTGAHFHVEGCGK